MIDRGALVVAIPTGGSTYRGVNRPPLDGQTFTGRRGKDLAQRYRDGLVAGEGVIEDLDEAIAVRDAAVKIGIAVEVIVFELPQEPRPKAGSLPIAPTPPVEGLAFLGYDAIEPLEPYWSPLAVATGSMGASHTNEHGLFVGRAEADSFKLTWSKTHPNDDALEVVRVWAAP